MLPPGAAHMSECEAGCCVQHNLFTAYMFNTYYTTEITICYTNKSKEPHGIILQFISIGELV